MANRPNNRTPENARTWPSSGIFIVDSVTIIDEPAAWFEKALLLRVRGYNLRRMKPPWFSRPRQRWLGVFLLAFAIVHLVVAWQERMLLARSYGDFSALYTAGLMARRGMGRQLYDRHAQWRIQQEFA